MRKFAGGIMLLFIFCALALRAAPAFAVVTLSAEVSPATATIGDRLTYTITLKGDEGEELIPQVRLTDPGPFEIIGVKKEKSATPDSGATTAGIIFTLAPFETGRLKLPVYVYEWKDGSGKARTVKTDEIFVEIKSVISGKSTEPDPNAIRGQAEPRLDWAGYITAAIIVLLVIAGAVFLFTLIRRRNRQKAEPAAPPETPYEAAVTSLNRIKRENLYASGKVKRYFSDVSDTIRRYMENGFHVEAMEKTTSELENDFPESLEKFRGEVTHILRLCDGAKFAKIIPKPNEAEYVLKSARDFVEKTGKPKIEPAPEKEVEPV